MEKYYCPYCNPKYQFSKYNHGQLVCGLCGEDLIKKPVIKSNQIIALILVFSFFLPFVLIFISSLINFRNDLKRDFQSNNQLILYTKNYYPQ